MFGREQFEKKGKVNNWGVPVKETYHYHAVKAVKNLAITLGSFVPEVIGAIEASNNHVASGYILLGAGAVTMVASGGKMFFHGAVMEAMHESQISAENNR